METSSRTTFTDKVSTSGPMVVFTMVNGLTTKWKVKALLPGVMDVDTKALTKMIRNTGMEPSNGPTVENTLVNGAKGNNMGREFTSKRVKRDKAFGRWARE